jgi:hypothetical protein
MIGIAPSAHETCFICQVSTCRDVGKAQPQASYVIGMGVCLFHRSRGRERVGEESQAFDLMGKCDARRGKGRARGGMRSAHARQNKGQGVEGAQARTAQAICFEFW